MKVKITSDSTCDLSAELLARYDISIVPLTVSMGESEGKDGVDVTPDRIYEFVDSSGVLPKTSAPNVNDYMTEFSKWAAQGYSIVHFCIGNGFSSSYTNACLAAEEFRDVYVVDSENLSTGQGLLVLMGADMARDGRTAGEIREACAKAVSKVEASFVIDRLDYLYKGGRCSALAAFGGNVLRLKPCIEVLNGKMTPGRKYRGQIERAMRQYAEDRIHGRTDIDAHRVFVTHTKCSPEAVEAVKDIIRRENPEVEEILETTAGATITSHCGPNTLGVLFMRV